MAAQDLAQETFVRLWQVWRDEPAREIHPGWLYTVARRLAIDRARQRARRPETLVASGDDHSAGPGSNRGAGGSAGAGGRGRSDAAGAWAGAVASDEDRLTQALDVQHVLDALPDEDQEMLFLFYYQEWASDEIARHYGMPAATVRTRLHRARARFRQLWEEA